MSPTTSFFAALALLTLPLINAAPRPLVDPITPSLLSESESQILLDTYPSRGIAKRDTSCLDSTATAQQMNSLLYYGGAGYVLSLCPGALIQMEEPVWFYAANQEISTAGYPTGDDRATMKLVNNTLHFAVFAGCDQCQGVALRNVQIDGGRLELGHLEGGGALVEFGGNTFGQVIDNCHLYEPRGWSCLHAGEGWHNTCNSMFITNNQVGPCGNSPNDGKQFRKRDTDWTTPTSSLTTFVGGDWADGISLACKNSTVTGNTITDATDGGIVIFNAPGSTVKDNTVIVKTRVLMGGINAVDSGPFDGDFGTTVVDGNTIISESNMIKIGIAVGGLVWGTDNRTASRTSFGTFTNNVLKSGPTGFFGYAIAVAGHENATVLGNDATGANFGGESSQWCLPTPGVPTTQAFVYDQYTTPGSLLQNNFVQQSLAFLICQQPGSIVATGPVTPLVSSIVIGSGSSPFPISSSAASSSSSSTTVASPSASSSSTTDAASSSPVASSSSSDIPSSSSASASVVASVAPTTTAASSTTDADIPSSTTLAPASSTTTVNARQAELSSRKAAAKSSRLAALASARAAAKAAQKSAGVAARRSVVELPTPNRPRATPSFEGLVHPFDRS